MAAVLGVSAEYHDAAAALVVDGKVIAAMQEERFSRIKNDPQLPLAAARACLAFAGIEARALDRVVFYEDPFAKLERVLRWTLQTFPRSVRQFPVAMATQLGGKLWVLDRLAEGLGVERTRVVPGEHHRCHAASAFFSSPFTDAAVLCVDGVGESATTSLWHGQDRTLQPLGALTFPHSLGLLYGALTAYLGFEVNEGEYKVMGLAAFGTARYLDEFHKLIQIEDDGSFALDLSYFAYDTAKDVGFSAKLESLLGPRRSIGKPWDLGPTGADARYADVAASLQAITEQTLLALAKSARQRTGSADLCLAGGVALNAVANARIAKEAGFSRVFVQPAAGDAGGALGAAVLGALDLGDARCEPLESCALGTRVQDDEVRSLATALGMPCSAVPSPVDATVDALLEGQIVAVVQDRFEWGPRALGQRSILAMPAQSDVRERINRVIKKREPFRPFAPAVLAENASTYFDGAPNHMTPFMTTVCPVHDSARDSLRAVTHVDGTARVQTVTASSAPFLRAVLSELARRGEPPVVLNTSLNGPGEPIVARATDALGFVATHPVDVMIIGEQRLTRSRA
jgi:carbamoyltransferase